MSDHATNDTTTQSPDRATAANSPMIVCALLLAVFLGVMLSPIVNQTAKAEMIAESGHLITMTAKGGNEDVLVILDNRTEQLTVYKVGQQNALELVQRLDLPELFQSARAKRLGGN